MATRAELALPRLRTLRAEDLPEVLAIEQRAYPFPWTEQIFRDCLRVGYHAWAVLLDERLVGYGLLSTAAGEAHLLNLAIDPPCQGHGLARQLLEHLLRIAARRAARTVFLEVRPSNARALALYHAAGFCEVGYRKGYYPAGKRREDAVILALEL
ncbi:MAG TPA: ribosomal protein S18-alanine N-acetyltransferase [Gammaproteobacteria bacterium]